jgi:O-acetylhomoserine/O-acetylserine sulfhydrylase-like pyridoxal-dependent enzyme
MSKEGIPMGFNTRQIHAGVEPDPVTGSILTPIYQTTSYVQECGPYSPRGTRIRVPAPTVRALEKKLSDLEGGVDCTCYGTGMAALQAVYLAFLNAGDHAIVSDVVYGGTYRLSTKVFSRFGVNFTFADTSKPEEVRGALRRTRS